MYIHISILFQNLFQCNLPQKCFLCYTVGPCDLSYIQGCVCVCVCVAQLCLTLCGVCVCVLLSCIWLFAACVCVCVAQLCLTLCSPMDYSPPGSSVHEILQARTLECIAIPSSKGSSCPRDQTQVSCNAGGRFTIWATREAQYCMYVNWFPSPSLPRMFPIRQP